LAVVLCEDDSDAEAEPAVVVAASGVPNPTAPVPFKRRQAGDASSATVKLTMEMQRYRRMDMAAWPGIKEYFGISDSFPVHQLFQRAEGMPKVITFATVAVAETCLYDESQPDSIRQTGKKKLKVVQCGLKAFDRDLMGVRPTRIMQEALHIVLPFMTKRVVTCEPEEFMNLLCSMKDVDISTLSATTQEVLQPLDIGSVAVVLKIDPTASSGVGTTGVCARGAILSRGGVQQLAFVIWRGRKKINSMVQKDDRMSLLAVLLERFGLSPPASVLAEAGADAGASAGADAGAEAEVDSDADAGADAETADADTKPE